MLKENEDKTEDGQRFGLVYWCLMALSAQTGYNHYIVL